MTRLVVSKISIISKLSAVILCEAENADKKTAEEFPAMIHKLIEEGGFIYTLDQISNSDETGIYYKCMHLV